MTKSTQEQAKEFAELAHQRILAGDHSNAESLLKAALDLDPQCFEAQFTLGSVAGSQCRWKAALIAAQAANKIRPDDPRVLTNIGLYLNQLQRFDEADNVFEKAYNILTENLDWFNNERIAYLHNRGLLRYNQNRPKEAVYFLQEAVELYEETKKSSTGVRSDLSMAVLKTGQLHKGLELNEVRWDGMITKSPAWQCGLPKWEGQGLREKTILVHHEQGFGDTIQFIRYIPRLRLLGAQVIFAAPRPLMPLLEGQCGIDEVIDLGQVGALVQASHQADYHCPLLSVVCRLVVEFEDQSEAGPYLQSSVASAHRVNLPAGKGFKVGLIWAASPGLQRSRERSVALDDLAVLAGLPGVKLYSLQYGPYQSDIERLGLSTLITDLVQPSDDFADLAQQMSQMDLVVSVDTAGAHLAGALGVRTWLLQPITPCWRWSHGVKVWYGSMNEYRQVSPDSWDEPIGEMLSDLEELLNEPART